MSNSPCVFIFFYSVYLWVNTSYLLLNLLCIPLIELEASPLGFMHVSTGTTLVPQEDWSASSTNVKHYTIFICLAVTSLIPPFPSCGKQQIITIWINATVQPNNVGSGIHSLVEGFLGWSHWAGGGPPPVFGRRMLSILSLAKIQISVYMLILSRFSLVWTQNSLA